MRNPELNRQLQRIRGLIVRSQGAAGLDLELQAHWGRYLCVLVAGFLENSIEEVYADFAQRVASPKAARFISRELANTRNPNAEKFVQAATKFDPAWGEDLRTYLQEGGRKEALDGIIANRNAIAHGQDTRITVAAVNSYLDKCVEVVEFIEVQCA